MRNLARSIRRFSGHSRSRPKRPLRRGRASASSLALEQLEDRQLLTATPELVADINMNGGRVPD